MCVEEMRLDKKEAWPEILLLKNGKGATYIFHGQTGNIFAFFAVTNAEFTLQNNDTKEKVRSIGIRTALVVEKHVDFKSRPSSLMLDVIHVRTNSFASR